MTGTIVNYGKRKASQLLQLNQKKLKTHLRNWAGIPFGPKYQYQSRLPRNSTRGNPRNPARQRRPQRMRMRFRRRGGGSKTKTKNKKKSQIKPINQLSTDQDTKSWCQISYKPTPKNRFWKVVSAKYFERTNAQASSLSAIGTQGCTDSRINADYLTWLTSTEINAQAGRLFNFYTSSNQAVSITASGYTSKRMLIERVSNTFSFMNCGPTDAWLTIWAINAKESLVASYVDPVADWADGYIETDGNSTGMTVNTIGAKPSDSEAFNRNWKIKGTTKVLLSPGRMHKFTVNVKLNKIVNLARWNEGCVAMRGYTGAVLWAAYGIPIDDKQYAVSSMTGTVTTGITTAPTKIIVNQDKSSVLRAVNIMPDKLSYYNKLATTAGGTQEFYAVNEASDVPLEIVTNGAVNQGNFA